MILVVVPCGVFCFVWVAVLFLVVLIDSWHRRGEIYGVPIFGLKEALMFHSMPETPRSIQIIVGLRWTVEAAKLQSGPCHHHPNAAPELVMLCLPLLRVIEMKCHILVLLANTVAWLLLHFSVAQGPCSSRTCLLGSSVANCEDQLLYPGKSIRSDRVNSGFWCKLIHTTYLTASLLNLSPTFGNHRH